MSIFNWFSTPPQTQTAAEDKQRPPGSRKKSAAAPLQEPEADARSDSARLRHLRRDQVFVAIREAMTKTGILPAHYKFKVFSEDSQGNEFVVLTSLVTQAAEPAPLLGEMEADIIGNAQAHFGIVVSAVYWRLTEVEAAVQFVPPPAKPKSPYETIGADEVIAFQQALLAASAQSSAERSSSDIARSSQSSSKLRDFEDTEMSHSASSPVLSKTQYGDLA